MTQLGRRQGNNFANDMKSEHTGQTKEQSQLISEELVFPWLDLKRCRQSLYHLPYNHHQLFDNGTLSNLGAENSHRRNISRAAMLLPIFQFFFLTMGYHHLQNSYNPIQETAKVCM